MTTSTATRPLDGPFMTGRQITDYSATPGYAIRLPDTPPGVSVAARVLDRLDTRKAAA